MTSVPISERGTAMPALTSLRFVAAFLVFITHVGFMAPFANPELSGVFFFVTHPAGHLGVGFFFVLSGFVLAWSARPTERAVDFYRRRIAKIFPNHLVVVLPAVGVVFLAGMNMGAFPIFVNYLLLLHPWIWSFEFASQSPNSPSWTLGVELFFYALFPLLIILVRRIRRENVWRWWIAAVVLIFLIPFVVMMITPSGPPSPAFPGGTWLQQKFLLFFPLTRLPEFFLGMLTARLTLERRFVKVPVYASLVLIVVVYAAGLFLPPVYSFASLWVIPVALLISAATGRETAVPKFLESRIATWAGEASYAFYLIHVPILMFAFYLVSRAMTGDGSAMEVNLSVPVALLFILTVAAITLVLSRLLYVAVERPAMRRWGRSGAAKSSAGSESAGRKQDTAASAPVDQPSSGQS